MSDGSDGSNIKTMVFKKLAEDLYDGLYNAERGCACRMIDLMPCGEPSTSECMAGVYLPDDESGHDFIIGERE